MNRMSRRQLAQIAAVTGAIAAPALILPKWHDARPGLVRADAGDLANMVAGHFAFGMVAKGGLFSSTTYSPSDKDSLVTLSNGNLTATGSNTAQWHSARGTTANGAGSRGFAVTIGSGSASGVVVGIANSSMGLGDPPGVLDGNAVAFHGGSGFYNSGQISSTERFAAGDVIYVGLIGTTAYFFKNGTLLRSVGSLAATGWFPLAGFYQVTTPQNANFNATSPSGYSFQPW